jgi:hypothetical protein
MRPGLPARWRTRSDKYSTGWQAQPASELRSAGHAPRWFVAPEFSRALVSIYGRIKSNSVVVGPLHGVKCEIRGDLVLMFQCIANKTKGSNIRVRHNHKKINIRALHAASQKIGEQHSSCSPLGQPCSASLFPISPYGCREPAWGSLRLRAQRARLVPGLACFALLAQASESLAGHRRAKSTLRQQEVKWKYALKMYLISLNLSV